MALMELRDVTVAFEGQAAVEHISLKIERGEYTVMLGRNGSGKTTLMRAMLGLVRPKAGQILLGDGLRRDHIGYMPQKTQAQRDFPASVEEVVRSGLINRMGLRMRYSAADDLLMLDEPVAALDPEATEGLYEVIRMLHRERGMAVLMISHDVQAAVRDADRVVVLDRDVLFNGTRQAYAQWRKENA